MVVIDKAGKLLNIPVELVRMPDDPQALATVANADRLNKSGTHVTNIRHDRSWYLNPRKVYGNQLCHSKYSC
jgi:hypothetical protein